MAFTFAQQMPWRLSTLPNWSLRVLAQSPGVLAHLPLVPPMGVVGWMISFPVDDFIEISKESIWTIWILPLKNHWFCSENDLPMLVFPWFFFHIYVNVYPVKVHPKGKDL
jgi:hypothetical protein